MSSRYLVAFCAAVLAGCTVLPPAEPTPEPEGVPEVEIPVVPPAEREIRVPRSDIELLLGYFQRVKKLSGAELGREQEGARLAFGRSGSDFDRVRLAMALAVPNAAGGDEPRAVELLDPLVRNRGSNLHALAYLLSAFVQEQRRLGASVQGMQRKLDQLRSMERSLIEREQAGKKRP